MTSSNENNATKVRHISHLEDDFLESHYDLKRIYKDLGKRIELDEAIIKKFIEGEGNGNTRKYKTN